MPKGKQGQRRPADLNKLAACIVEKATTGGDSPLSAKRAEAGRMGGQKRAEMSPEERSRIAKEAADKRWKD